MIPMLMLSVTSCSLLKSFITKPETGLKVYEGKWYVIAAFPNKFEKGLVCSTSVYKYNEDGTLTVTNSGRDKSSGKVKTFTAKVWLPDKNRPDTFRVQIFFTITRDYNLVYMAEDNSCAILGSPSKHQMWILSRTPCPDEEITAMLVKIAADRGYRTERLEKVEQVCEE